MRSSTMITSTGVAELGTIVGIWAHPDDEAYLSGGLMAMARDNGQRVVCVTATRGELGTPPDPVAELAAERTREMASCLAVLAVREHHWLDYRDGECAAAELDDAVERLCAVIDDVRPDTASPDGITGHPDPCTVSAWAGAAFDRAAPSGARLLHAATPEPRAARWGELNERLGVYMSGYPIVTAPEGLAVDVVLDRRGRTARSGRWRRRRRRPPG